MSEHLAKPADGYLIMKRGLYYRPNAMGYTGIREKAGRYSLADAQAHADPESGVTFLHEGEAPELAPECLDEVANPYLLEKLEAARSRAGVLEEALQSAALNLEACAVAIKKGGRSGGRHLLAEQWAERARSAAKALGSAA